MGATGPPPGEKKPATCPLTIQVAADPPAFATTLRVIELPSAEVPLNGLGNVEPGAGTTLTVPVPSCVTVMLHPSWIVAGAVTTTVELDVNGMFVPQSALVRVLADAPTAACMELCQGFDCANAGGIADKSNPNTAKSRGAAFILAS